MENPPSLFPMLTHRTNSWIFALNCGLILLFTHSLSNMCLFIFCAFLLFALFLTLGVIFPQRNYFLPSISRLNNNKVLLTFDDGPHELHTPHILETLKKHNVGAYFFVIGKRAEQHPEIILQMLKDGHVVGNHTQNHPWNFAMLSRQKVEEEIDHCDATLHSIGLINVPYFRLPIGFSNPRIAKGIKKKHKQSVSWTWRSLDTKITNEQQLLKRLTDKIQNNHIVLLHDNLRQTASVLDRFIQAVKKKGIQFVTIDELQSSIQ